MVFAALSEYSLILFIKFRKSAPIQKDSHKTGIQTGIGNNDGGKNNFHVDTMGRSKGGGMAVIAHHDEKDCDTSLQATTNDLDTTSLVLKKIDCISLFLFLVTFSLFLVIYFVLYCSN